MRIRILLTFFIVSYSAVWAQPLLLLDRFNENKVVNDSTIYVFSSDFNIHDLTQYFTMKNTTDETLAVYLRKSINFIADSTTDYYCFGIRCWPGDDSTNVADSIPPGGEDYTFASHVTHKRRFDLPQPLLPPGYSSITYTVYDKTTLPEPVEASVTVVYHLGGVGFDDTATKRWGDRENVAVYPNPAKDFVNIDLPRPDGSGNIKIYNNLGCEILDFPYREGGLRRFNLSGHPQGIYFLSITGNGRTSTLKFSIVH